MTAATLNHLARRPVTWIALILALSLIGLAGGDGWRQGLLVPIGLAMGWVLRHAAFGFTGAYRRAIVDKDISAVSAQLVMLAAALLLFTPVLVQGGAFGQAIGGAVAPVNLAMALGAFLFGIGMQLGSSCASGTLFGIGGGSFRTILVLVFFCLGAFWASLDLGWWTRAPSLGSISLTRELGYGLALPLQLAILVGAYGLLRLWGGKTKETFYSAGFWRQGAWWRGPWPLLAGGLALALLNWLTLVTAGHPWSITWGFTLWGAKAAALAGWTPSGNWFWTGGYQETALQASIFSDSVSVMNLAIILGATFSALAAGQGRMDWKLGWRPLLAAVLGGLMMGYGARLAYGCNIGAFFSGVASSSLHGWVWILCAIPGNIIGVRLRPWFSLRNR